MREDAVLAALQHGPLHRFADWQPAFAARPGRGVDTIWDIASGPILYVGTGGNGDPGKPQRLYGRLGQHASGGRSVDCFWIHVQDRFVPKILTTDDIKVISDATLSLERVARDHIHRHMACRVAETATLADARRIDDRIRRGGWPVGLPLLDPTLRSAPP